MENKMENFKIRFDSLTSNYISSYTGKQPIMSVWNKEKVKVEFEFLEHLPMQIKSTVENLIAKINEIN